MMDVGVAGASVRDEAGGTPARMGVAPRRLALAALLLAAAALNLWQVDRIGYGNPYYAAAIKSMLLSWHNFFYVSFDPGGFVSIDKPPLGFWLQALSARLLGFGGVSLLLPQIVAGVLSVAVVYRLVGRTFGTATGLLAGLFLALTPVAVAINRNNSVDSVLVLLLLLAAWAALRATEGGGVRWLLACAALLGLGFNVKMLQAYLVLPACGALYLVAAHASWARRLRDLALATALLLVVSFAWVVAVDSTPAAQRPYVGSSCTNSALNLAIGYNGLVRLAGMGQAHAGCDTSAAQSALPGGPGLNETGNAGPLRLFNAELGGQVSWLLPLALLGIVVGAVRRRPLLPLDRRGQSVLLWGIWLLTTAVFFSIAGFFHTYYLVMMAPPVAALAAIALGVLWQARAAPGPHGWGLAPTVLGAAVVEVLILLPYPDWSRWLTPVVLLGAAGAVLLTVARLRPGPDTRLSRAGLGLAIAALVAAPAAWSVDTVGSSNALIPRGGPTAAGSGPGLGALASGAVSEVDTSLLRYLQAHRGRATYLVGMTSALSAAPYILATGEPVMAVGGFSGGDQILTTTRLASLVRRGAVRYFLLQGPGGPLGGLPAALLKEAPLQVRAAIAGASGGAAFSNAATRWVTGHCVTVPPSRYGGAAQPGGVPTGGPDGGFPSGGAGGGPPAGGPGGGLPSGGPSSLAGGFGASQQLYDCAAPATVRGDGNQTLTQRALSSAAVPHDHR